MELADADSPTRCQHQSATKQCEYESVKGSNHCEKHNKTGPYRFKKLFARVGEIASHPQTKSVAVEKAVLQHQLETIMNSCETEADALVNEHKVTNLVVQISKLSLIDHKLAVAHGRMLDAETLGRLIDDISNIIAENVSDKAVQALIAEGINNAIERATTEAAQKASDKIITE